MLKKLLSLRLILAIIALPFVFALGGCGQNSPVQPNITIEQTAPVDTTQPGRIDAPALQLAVSYPAWYKELPVPWISQLSIPGSAAASTKACGQTCVTMIDGFYYGYTPVYQHIVQSNNFLDWKFPGLGYATPNSYYTHFTGRNALGTLITNKGYAYQVAYGSSVDDLARVFRAINDGFPVIVGVNISGGNIVTSGGVAHWVVAVGFDQNYGGQIILNDPGTQYGSKGNKKHMSLTDFDRSWALNGRIFVPVMKGICRSY